MTTLALPYPKLVKGRFASICAYTDTELFEKTGVRIAFTCREGGVSTGAYSSLNLGSHVDDDLKLVDENRARVLEAFACSDAPLIVPNQVHGDTVLVLEGSDAANVEDICLKAKEGADGLIVGASQVAALLCFADCVPVIIVSPSKRFAVVHAGWRGVMNTISVKAVRRLAELDQNDGIGLSCQSSYNVYIGPHIRRECFETSEELYEKFIEVFGSSCDAGYRHIDLAQALKTQLVNTGIMPDRIFDLGLCTVCHNEEFFSFRAQGGIAGRHGAFAYRS